ncbi:oxysterol-binding protein-related protein 2-like [Pollicipes pollicipes]|uniref:oxysterol-binding protein-related protein 2-like n=1 Tax=Pollicipes pollicipes TaxID=41117 RepID=UPI001884F3F4|nr:oxysterol-binding protein-related protein 2-like [Pollicipes pollicipes]
MSALAVDLTQDDQMRQVLGVTPLRRLQRSAVRCEGPLVRRHRFTGWKPVWAVLERGVLTYFSSRGDASSGVKRKDFKYLDGARVASDGDPEGATLVVRFSDGTMHRLRCDDGDDRVSRQKWVNALQEHIDFSSHYIRQGLGLEDPEEDGVKSLGSMQDAMQSAKAQEQLLREHLQEITFVMSSLHSAEAVPHSLAVVERLRETSECAKEMVGSLAHCLALFTQQEEVRQLQLRQERERCRVLEQSLHVLATEHHQLEESLHRSLSSQAPPSQLLEQHCVTSEDEFFDADDTELSDDDLTLTSCTTPSISTPATLSEADVAAGSSVSLASSETVVSTEGGRYRRPAARLAPGLAGRPLPPSQRAYGRIRLPKEQTSADNFSVWSVLKSAIGKELTKISMPVVFNEPLSFLQRMTEYMEYSHLLQAAAQEQDSITRMQYVAAFAVSGLASNWERVGKPFNPLLGETFELHRSGFRMVCEQVSHHPPVSAFHAEGDAFRFHGSIQPKLKFWGRSVEIEPRGLLTVELPGHDEAYTWSNVNCCVHNIIVGKLWIEQYGTMEITNHRIGDQCTILFKPAGWFSKELHRLEGFVADKSKVRRRFLYGKWTDFLRSTDMQSYEEYEKLNSGQMKQVKPSKLFWSGQNGEVRPAPVGHRGVLSKLNSITATTFKAPPEREPGPEGDGDGPAELGADGEVPRCSSLYSIDIPNSVTLWEADPRPAHSRRYYNFTSFAMALNQPEPELQLCRTDCRLRPDIRALEEGNIDLAAAEKNRLEEKQRDARKARGKRKDVWQARYFKRCSNPHVKVDDWLFTDSYWDERHSSQLDIF